MAYHFKSLWSLLAISCSCQFWRLEPFLFRLLFCIPTTTVSFRIHLSYNHPAWSNRKCSLSCWGSLFTMLLLSNGLPIVVTPLSGKVFTRLLPSSGLPIVECTCGTGMCLPSRCQAMGMHVTIILNKQQFTFWELWVSYLPCSVEFVCSVLLDKMKPYLKINMSLLFSIASKNCLK
jgi:hypothetical protein